MTELSTGEVARACGVSPDTIRFYERRGVIRARRVGRGDRRFPDGTIGRVRIVRNAIAIGFTIDEIVRFFSDRQAGRLPCHQVRAAAEEKLAALDRQIADMMALRDQLSAVLADWDHRLAHMPAHLLESLPERSTS